LFDEIFDIFNFESFFFILTNLSEIKHYLLIY